MEYIVQFLTTFFGSAIALGIVGFLARNYFLERFKLMLQKEHSEFVDKLQWDRKVKEQAARVAEYLVLASRLEIDSPKIDYDRANQLSWELAMWIPDNIYREMTNAIIKPSENLNPLTVSISVRRLLLGDKAGNLPAEEIAGHAPGIGKK